LEDVTHHVTQWFKQPGDIVVLLGETLEELGGSEYLAVVHNKIAGAPPGLDLDREKRLQQLCLSAARERICSSAHDLAEGGLGVALAEACITHPQKPLGARVTLPSGLRPDILLFSESQSRVLVSLPANALPRLRSLAEAAHVPLSILGAINGSDLIVDGCLQISVSTLKETWQTALAQRLSTNA
jgi:phosphoribosylformylglycinamidine synthase